MTAKHIQPCYTHRSHKKSEMYCCTEWDKFDRMTKAQHKISESQEWLDYEEHCDVVANGVGHSGIVIPCRGCNGTGYIGDVKHNECLGTGDDLEGIEEYYTDSPEKKAKHKLFIDKIKAILDGSAGK